MEDHLLLMSSATSFHDFEKDRLGFVINIYSYDLSSFHQKREKTINN